MPSNEGSEEFIARLEGKKALQWDHKLRIAEHIRARDAEIQQLREERDTAVSEMHSRELHHFESEQKLEEYAAVIERVERMAAEEA